MALVANRKLIALLYGAVCHAVFGLAGLIMTLSLGTGLMFSVGAIAWPWAILANLFLVVQFPLAHSLLLTDRGRAALKRLAPNEYGSTLSTTVYAIIASLQLIILFVFWTPSGVIVWRADGALLILHLIAFAGSWLFLAKSTLDAGIQLQTGALGWLALFRGKQPQYPDMPEKGVFKLVRQPIYLSFALALWTGPVWTLDKVALATAWTAYCYLAPTLKEKRFARYYGPRFEAYRAQVPYFLPRVLPRFGQHKHPEHSVSD